MSAQSDVEICSTALGLLGAQPIMSLTDDPSERAKLCGRLFEPTRDALLQDHPWTFAKERVKLARHMLAPVYGWRYAYRLPVDYVQLVELEPPDTPYQIESGQVLTDAEMVWVAYVRRVVDPGQFPPKFTQALTYKLASVLAVPITGDTKRATLYHGLYEQTLGRGKNRDTVADPVQEYRSDTLLLARW